jgi:hypothetical protein
MDRVCGSVTGATRSVGKAAWQCGAGVEGSCAGRGARPPDDGCFRDRKEIRGGSAYAWRGARACVSPRGPRPRAVKPARCGGQLTLKLTPLKMAAMSGVMRAFTMAVTRLLNARLRQGAAGGGRMRRSTWRSALQADVRVADRNKMSFFGVCIAGVFLGGGALLQTRPRPAGGVGLGSVKGAAARRCDGHPAGRRPNGAARAAARRVCRGCDSRACGVCTLSICATPTAPPPCPTYTNLTTRTYTHTHLHTHIIISTNKNHK